MPKTVVDRFEQRRQTRAKLIDAALQLFSTSGYEHATVDDISQAAGYSKGAYYFHFSTKEDILLELLRMWAETRAQILAAAEGEAQTTDSLQELVAEFFSYAQEPRWPAVLLEFWSQALRNDEVRRRLDQAYGSYRAELTRAFESASRSTGRSSDGAAEAASVTLAAHDGYAVQVAVGAPAAKAMQPDQLAGLIVAPFTQRAAGEERRTAVR